MIYYFYRIYYFYIITLIYDWLYFDLFFWKNLQYFFCFLLLQILIAIKKATARASFWFVKK